MGIQLLAGPQIGAPMERQASGRCRSLEAGLMDGVESRRRRLFMGGTRPPRCAASRRTQAPSTHAPGDVRRAARAREGTRRSMIRELLVTVDRHDQRNVAKARER